MIYMHRVFAKEGKMKCIKHDFWSMKIDQALHHVNLKLFQLNSK